METVYPELDMEQVSDHFVIINKKYYYSLRNAFSMINTQISKLLYFLVFHFSWLYFVYVYVRQLFSSNINNQSKTASSVLDLFFNTVSKKNDVS